MIDKIRKLLEDARTKEALELLATKRPEAGTLLATFNDATRRHNLGLIDYKEFSLKLSQVNHAALEYLLEMEQSGNVGNTNPSNTSTMDNKPKKMFISYSKADKAYLEEFKKQLAIFRLQGLLETWDDTNLKAGEEWDKAIKHELQTADIIVLLVSADLISTEYIWNVEMKAALERSQRKEAIVIPVIIRACMWEKAPFGKLNALPEKGVPIDKWDNKDEAWAQVVKRIESVL